MKILFLTSPAPDSGWAYTYAVGKCGEKRFPLGLGYLMGALRNNSDIKFNFVDLRVKNIQVDFSLYDFIGISADTICFKDGTIPLLNKIKISNFKGKIIMGGPHTTVMPDTIPPYVDYVVQGEGEEVILPIIKGDINQRIIKTKRILDLDKLSMPAYDMFDLSLYNLSIEEYSQAKKVFTYSSSRGCPYSCLFCSSKNFFNRSWTCHSAERVVNDIKYLKDRYKIDGIYFREDNFSINKDRLRKICELLINDNVNISWKCEMRVDVSYDDLKLMKEAGLKSLYVGFESGSEKLLKYFKKNITVDQSRKFNEYCKKIGISIYGSFIFGTPRETKEDIQLTNKFIEELKLSRLCRCKYIAQPGSEMYNEVIENPQVAKDKNITVIKG